MRAFPLQTACLLQPHLDSTTTPKYTHKRLRSRRRSHGRPAADANGGRDLLHLLANTSVHHFDGTWQRMPKLPAAKMARRMLSVPGVSQSCILLMIDVMSRPLEVLNQPVDKSQREYRTDRTQKSQYYAAHARYEAQQDAQRQQPDSTLFGTLDFSKLPPGSTITTTTKTVVKIPDEKTARNVTTRAPVRGRGSTQTRGRSRGSYRGRAGLNPHSSPPRRPKTTTS